MIHEAKNAAALAQLAPFILETLAQFTTIADGH